MEAIALRLEAIALRLEAITTKDLLHLVSLRDAGSWKQHETGDTFSDKHNQTYVIISRSSDPSGTSILKSKKELGKLCKSSHHTPLSRLLWQLLVTYRVFLASPHAELSERMGVDRWMSRTSGVRR